MLFYGRSFIFVIMLDLVHVINKFALALSDVFLVTERISLHPLCLLGLPPMVDSMVSPAVLPLQSPTPRTERENGSTVTSGVRNSSVLSLLFIK